MKDPASPIRLRYLALQGRQDKFLVFSAGFGPPRADLRTVTKRWFFDARRELPLGVFTLTDWGI